VKIYELNHVAIHVKDVEASCEFYKKVLQLKQIPRPAFTFPGAWFQLGSIQELHIIGDRTDPVFSQNRGNHYALRVDELDGWERHFEKLGIAYRTRKMRPDGAWQIYVTDPDGHYVELYTPPPDGPASTEP
jgi:lactoylglutathione lyase